MCGNQCALLGSENLRTLPFQSLHLLYHTLLCISMKLLFEVGHGSSVVAPL